MKKISLVYLIYFVATSYSFGQTEYYTGASTISIEPDNSVFSTALAGYGLPREGRFSLSWEYLSALPEIKAVTGHEGQLYAVTPNKEFLVLGFSDTLSGFKKISSSEDITALAALNGKLYGVNDKDQVLLAQETGKEISWKRIGKAPKIQKFTGYNGSFYGINDSGKLVVGTLSGNQISWDKPGVWIPEGRIISLSSDNDRLYALNENDSLWAGELHNNKLSWIQIGRNNSLTYAIKARHIAVNKDRLFAVSDENKLYINRHSTEGNLSARALAVQSGDKTAIIVSLDLCGFEKSLTDEIRETVFQKHGIHKAAVLINATHTHFAPITQKWYALGEFYETPNPEYLQKVKRSVVQAIGEALENMSPSKISFSRGSTAIGRNRRISSNADAPYDNVLDVIRITNLQENTNQILFLTGCHPVYENSGEASFTLSANYPGVARRVIERSTNTDNAIFMQGLGGDINPKTLDHKETGEELAENTLAILSEKMNELSGEISFFQDTVQIPIEPWHYNRIKEFKEENLNKNENLEAERNLRWAELMLDLYEKGTMPASLPVYVQTINIGNWKLIGLSREVVNEYGPAIRALWPDQLVSVAGYCNDITSYLPVDWHINRGVYEGKGSFFWYGVPGTFPLGVKDQVINHIRTSKK